MQGGKSFFLLMGGQASDRAVQLWPDSASVAPNLG